MALLVAMLTACIAMHRLLLVYWQSSVSDRQRLFFKVHFHYKRSSHPELLVNRKEIPFCKGMV